MAVLFNARATTDAIVEGDRASITKLTKAQLAAVVSSLADRVVDLQKDGAAVAEQNHELSKQLADMRAEKKRSTTFRNRKMQEIMQSAAAKKALEPPPAPAAALPAPSTPDAPPFLTQSMIASPTPAAAPATAPQTRGWTSRLWNYIPTPFARKRSADDEPASTPEPSQKRQRQTDATTENTVEQPAFFSNTNNTAVNEQDGAFTKTASKQRISFNTAAKEQDGPSSAYKSITKQRTSFLGAKTNITNEQEQKTPLPKSALKQRSSFTSSSAAPIHEQEQETPLQKPAKKQQPHLTHIRTHTSDSDDQEQEQRTPLPKTASKQPSVENYDEEHEQEQQTPLPSTAKKQQYSATPTTKRKRQPTTPLTTISERTENSQPTDPPATTSFTPVRRRTIASVKAAKRAEMNKPLPRFAWEKEPKPRLKNADERLAKIRTLEDLRRKVKDLEQDEDVRRPTKRVKVDNLAEIPHNRPGDASSTFRVPDIDSDDEMEVDWNVEERSNVFDDTPQHPTATPLSAAQAPEAVTTAGVAASPPPFPLEKQQSGLADQPTASPSLSAPPQQPPAQPLPPQQPLAPKEPPRFNFPSVGLKPTVPASVPEVHAQPAPPAPPQQRAEPPRFVFPSVGLKPPGFQEYSEERKKACGALFAAGFAEYMKTK